MTLPEAQNWVWRCCGLGLNFTGSVSLNSHNNLMRLVPLTPQSLRGGNRVSERSGSVPKVTEFVRIRSGDPSDSKTHVGNYSAPLSAIQ